MTEHTAKQWLQTEVLPHPEQYSLGHYAGPTQPSDLVAFLAQAKNDIKGAINLDKGSLHDPQYKFMSAKQVYKPGETNALFTRKVAEFFCLLFRKIRDDAKHQLTQYDLWHGHFVDAGSHGLVIIFHAKEQPSDIVTDGMDNSKSPFSSADTCFYGRNVLWMAESNTFYVLDAGDTSDIYTKYVVDRVSDYDPSVISSFTQTRTVWEIDLGTPRGFVYYNINTSWISRKSDHIVIAPQQS